MHARPPMPGMPAPGAPPGPGAAMGAPAAYVDPLGAPQGYRMANPTGPRYDGYRASGWNDQQMLAQGVMVRL